MAPAGWTRWKRCARRVAAVAAAAAVAVGEETAVRQRRLWAVCSSSRWQDHELRLRRSSATGWHSPSRTASRGRGYVAGAAATLSSSAAAARPCVWCVPVWAVVVYYTPKPRRARACLTAGGASSGRASVFFQISKTPHAREGLSYLRSIREEEEHGKARSSATYCSYFSMQRRPGPARSP